MAYVHVKPKFLLTTQPIVCRFIKVLCFEQIWLCNISTNYQCILTYFLYMARYIHVNSQVFSSIHNSSSYFVFPLYDTVLLHANAMMF
jgi:hypothetical protein